METCNFVIDIKDDGPGWDKHQRGTRTLDLTIGDIVHVNGQPHQILRYIGTKMLMRPISKSEEAGVAERLAEVRERMAVAGAPSGSVSGSKSIPTATARGGNGGRR
jgi:hypothetical protein